MSAFAWLRSKHDRGVGMRIDGAIFTNVGAYVTGACLETGPLGWHVVEVGEWFVRHDDWEEIEAPR